MLGWLYSTHKDVKEPAAGDSVCACGVFMRAFQRWRELSGRLQRRFGNPMDWSPVARFQFLCGLLFPFVIITAALVHLSASGYLGPFFNPREALHLAWFLDVIAALNLGMIVINALQRDYEGEVPWRILIFVETFTCGILLVYWSLGRYDTLGIYFLVVGLIIAMPLVELWSLAVGVWTALLLLPLIFLGEIEGWIPIAPVLSRGAGFSDPSLMLEAKGFGIAVIWLITVILWFCTSRFFRRWREREGEVRELSRIDPLTGVFNRRSFFDAFHAECARSKRTGRSLSLLMCDIDHFKKVNDTRGHTMGDEVLRKVARAIMETIREAVDLVGRFGGEEFVVLLPETAGDGALATAERIRGSIRHLEFSSNGEAFRITASLGTATASAGSPFDADYLLEAADQNLYQAKKAGRDRVVAGE